MKPANHAPNIPIFDWLVSNSHKLKPLIMISDHNHFIHYGGYTYQNQVINT